MKYLRIGLGLALVWGALGVAGYAVAATRHLRADGKVVTAAARAELRSHRASAGGACADSAGAGQLAGLLSIPAIGVTAPVEAGTSDAVLAEAVGHAGGYPWPGQPGTSVLLAHDVSYFADIDQLAPGSVITYETPCVVYRFAVTGHRVVAAGSAIPVAAAAAVAPTVDALVLDTCWPTDALWFTPNRYLVTAVETGFSQRLGSGRGSHLAPLAAPSAPATYTTPAPPALVAEGLTLDDNETPMGTLSITGANGAAGRGWAASPAPLALTTTGLEAYFGVLHASAQQQASWLADLAPGVDLPAALSGASVTGSGAPLDVHIALDGAQPDQVTLQTVVDLGGGPAPGTYDETVTEVVAGTVVTVAGWTLTPA